MFTRGGEPAQLQHRTGEGSFHNPACPRAGAGGDFSSSSSVDPLQSPQAQEPGKGGGKGSLCCETLSGNEKMETQLLAKRWQRCPAGRTKIQGDPAVTRGSLTACPLQALQHPKNTSPPSCSERCQLKELREKQMFAGVLLPEPHRGQAGVTQSCWQGDVVATARTALGQQLLILMGFWDSWRNASPRIP